MPKEFTDCVSGGGRVRTKKLPKGRHINICFDEKGSHAGYTKRKKKGS